MSSLKEYKEVKSVCMKLRGKRKQVEAMEQTGGPTQMTWTLALFNDVVKVGTNNLFARLPLPRGTA
jgi:hypothetical protein